MPCNHTPAITLSQWYINTEHPPPHLTSCRPVWSDMTPVDISDQWWEDWLSASVVNNVLITDLTIWQPGFDLPHQSWSLLNHFWTGHGNCLYNPHKWGLARFIRPVCAASSSKPWIIMCHLQSLEVDCNPYMKPVMMPSNGWSLPRLQHTLNGYNTATTH